MEQHELLKNLDEKFRKAQKEFGFKANLDEMDKNFFVRDSILKEGYVSESFSRQLCRIITETLMNWNEYLHSLIMPNPQNLLNMGESKIFNQDEKREITELMKKIMEICSRNSLIMLGGSKDEEGKYIEDSIKFWKSEFKPKITKIITKINHEWKS
ncbi:hypothetical protein HYT23_03165 [Candidatus Pacearchaeota archaeon]|nr:hypothetical protein [Candidatus Pacearchaeota archaeon]